MKSENAKKLINEIDVAIKDIGDFSRATDKEKSYLAKFLVVYICGIYEETIEIIINEMVGKLKNPEISKFVQNVLKRGFNNPNIETIKNFMKSFNDDWEVEIKNLPNDVKSALNSIVNNKNSIAHGISVNISLSDVEDYYDRSKIVIEKIDDMLL